MENFYTILTDTGKAKIANAHANRIVLELKEMAVGDGAGAYYNPSEKLTALKNEVYRRELNNMTTDPDNPNYLICEMVIPSDAGGFYIREAAIFDTDGDMIAIGKIPETYKPTLSAGAAKDLYMKFIIEVTNTAAVTLKIDPSVVLATKEMTEQAATNAVIAHVGQGNPHNQYVAKTAHNTDIANLQTALTGGLAGKENTFTVLPVGKGGTGAATATQARNNLGLGTAATQNVGTGSGQVPTYGAGQVLNGNVSGTAKTITDILGIDKGGTGNKGGQATSIGIVIDKYWQTDGSSNVFKYEQANTTVYKLPTPSCLIFKFSPYGSVGVAYAIQWANGVKMWISALHETWGEWVEVFDKKMVVPSVNGGTGHTSVAPFSPSIASHSISYILTTPLYVPAGGAWFYSFFTMTSGNPADNYAGVVAGGAMIHPAAAGYKALGFMWRIA